MAFIWSHGASLTTCDAECGSVEGYWYTHAIHILRVCVYVGGLMNESGRLESASSPKWTSQPRRKMNARR